MNKNVNIKFISYKGSSNNTSPYYLDGVMVSMLTQKQGSEFNSPISFCNTVNHYNIMNSIDNVTTALRN